LPSASVSVAITDAQKGVPTGMTTWRYFDCRDGILAVRIRLSPSIRNAATQILFSWIEIGYIGGNHGRPEGCPYRYDDMALF